MSRKHIAHVVAKAKAHGHRFGQAALRPSRASVRDKTITAFARREPPHSSVRPGFHFGFLGSLKYTPKPLLNDFRHFCLLSHLWRLTRLKSRPGKLTLPSISSAVLRC